MMKEENNSFRLRSTVIFVISSIINYGSFLVLLLWTGSQINNKKGISFIELLSSSKFTVATFVITLVTFIGAGILPSLYGLLTSLRREDKGKPSTQEGIYFREDLKDGIILMSYTIVSINLLIIVLFSLFPTLMNNLSIIIFLLLVLIALIIVPTIAIINIARKLREMYLKNTDKIKK